METLVGGWFKIRTSRIVSVCDIIWMFTCDWLVGRLSLERDLTNCLDPLSTDRLFSTISVLIKTLEIYVELWGRRGQKMNVIYFLFWVNQFYLKALILNAVRSSFVGDTGMLRQNFGRALSMSFFRLSALQSPDDDDDDVACLWNNINMASEMR